MGLVSVAQLPWPHFGRTRTLNAAAYCVPVSNISAGQRGNEQVADRGDTVDGSDARAVQPDEGQFRWLHEITSLCR